MRVNEENFATGDVEDIEPSYVEQVVGNHNSNSEAHPDIRKQIADTQAFYQSAKDSVQGIAEDAKSSATSAEEAMIIAMRAADEASVARDRAMQAEDAVKLFYPQIIDGEWYLYSEKEGCLAPSGVMATGPKPEKGIDYWTEEDKAEIKAYVDEAILGGEW